MLSSSDEAEASLRACEFFNHLSDDSKTSFRFLPQRTQRDTKVMNITPYLCVPLRPLW
jgi:hypothetical protein